MFRQTEKKSLERNFTTEKLQELNVSCNDDEVLSKVHYITENPYDQEQGKQYYDYECVKSNTNKNNDRETIRNEYGNPSMGKSYGSFVLIFNLCSVGGRWSSGTRSLLQTILNEFK